MSLMPPARLLLPTIRVFEMQNEADRARVRALEARIKSLALANGRYSVAGRAKPGAIALIAEAIASNYYASSALSDEELTRIMGTRERLNPGEFMTPNEMTASLQAARFDEQNKTIKIRDVSTALLTKLTPIEKLDYVHKNGELPRRFVKLDDNK